MKCVVCKHGETSEGSATITLERGELVVVFKKVPARVCQVCSETYVDDSTTEQLLRTAETISEAGVQVDIRTFVAA